MSVIRSKILGVGSYLPEKVMTNDDLSKMVETSDEWIVERTGIKIRHLAADEEVTSDLAVKAARDALENAGITAQELDAILVATTTPDQTFPATATKVQAQLGMTHGFAFDLQAVCSGFMYAMTMADSLIRAGQVKTILVIGAETLSRLVDWTDRNTCVLFGDGAGAVVLTAVQGQGTAADTGILKAKVFSDGTFGELLHTTGGPSSSRTVGTIFMNGKEVFRHAVGKLAGAAEDVLSEAGVSSEELTWLVPHQANLRIIDSTAKKLGLPASKVVVTVDHHANTSAASIPLALAEKVKSGEIKRGDLLLFDAMGGGFTWGAILVRF